MDESEAHKGIDSFVAILQVPHPPPATQERRSDDLDDPVGFFDLLHEMS